MRDRVRRRDPRPQQRVQPFSDDLLGRIDQLIDEATPVNEPWDEGDRDEEW